jgi:hypothetical protein
MKKIIDWFQELPEPQRSMAMNNCNVFDEEVESLSKAIIHGFAWEYTDEGGTYWNLFHDNIKREEFKQNRREDWELENKN